MAEEHVKSYAGDQKGADPVSSSLSRAICRSCDRMCLTRPSVEINNLSTLQRFSIQRDRSSACSSAALEAITGDIFSLYAVYQHEHVSIGILCLLHRTNAC